MKFALGIKKINKSYIDQTSSVRMVEVWPRSKAKKKLAKIQLSRRHGSSITYFIIYSEYRMLPLVNGYLVLVSTVFISGEEGWGRLTVVRVLLFYAV